MSTPTAASTPPDELDAVLEIVGELARRSAGGGYIYRGEPKAYPTVSSGLYRWYADIEAPAFDIEKVQAEILEQAKGYTSENDEFAILSQLQHHGGATNLIDFTTDFLIALFFAGNGAPEESGRVILLASTGDDYQVKEPNEPSHRIIAQKSVFVRPNKGFVEPDDVVEIPRDLKQSVLDYLREAHGIFTETIYNDLHGFIRNQGIHQSAYTEFFKGVTAHIKEKYQKAINHYSKAIELEPQHFPAYSNRGEDYFNIGEYESAIQDYNSVLELIPGSPELYYKLGEAWLHLGEWGNARGAFITALSMGGDIVASFRNDYISVADFGRRSGRTVPSDIAEMLSG